MSKEYLETLSKNIKFKKEFVGNDTYRLYLKKNDIELLEKELQRLEVIDNAEPSEALKCIEYIENKLDTLKREYKSHLNHRCDDLFIQKHIFTTIKQYILKAQTQENLLKIIKEKRVDMFILESVSCASVYNATLEKDFYKVDNYRFLTDEEFDSLKEMLNNEQIYKN